MLSDQEFIRQSLELNLFFMRIAKEHSIFLEAGFLPKNMDLIYQAEMLKNEFSQLIMETIRLSDGIISPEVINSGELTTDLTLNAEAETEYYTGIEIDENITKGEKQLLANDNTKYTYGLLQQVTMLNQRALFATSQIACFKAKILNDVLSCRLFTNNYPLLIDHILREAQFYIRMLTKLQSREEMGIAKEAIYQETFWNRIMAEHSKFIRGFLDPTEVKLFNTANDFGSRFDELTKEAATLSQNIGMLPRVTEKTLKAAIEIRDFKKTGTVGIINCNIKSIIYPLLGDHVVREANHYIRLLKSYQQKG